MDDLAIPAKPAEYYGEWDTAWGITDSEIGSRFNTLAERNRIGTPFLWESTIVPKAALLGKSNKDWWNENIQIRFKDPFHGVSYETSLEWTKALSGQDYLTAMQEVSNTIYMIGILIKPSSNAQEFIDFMNAQTK